MGRPSALEKDAGLAERICNRIERGNYPVSAAQAEGVPERTYYQWMEYAAEEREPYWSFSQNVARALAVAECDLVEQLRELPKDDRGKADSAQARALEFILERTRSERFGSKIEVKQKAEETLRDGLYRVRSLVSPGAWREVLAALASLSGEPASVGTGDDAAH